MPPGWERLLAVQADEASFLTPSVDERVALGDVVARLSRAAPRGVVPRRLLHDADALGLEIAVEDDVVWLTDADGRVRGTGLLALRLGELGASVVVQAPHPFDDAHTGVIALGVFAAGSIRGVMVATAERDVHEASDPSHAEEGAFNVMTVGLAESLGDALFVQLHGFAPSTSEAELVLSEGSARWGEGLDEVVDVMARALGVVDVRTGEDVPKLAGRKNAQSRVLADEASFLHVEMSRPLRDALVADPALQLALRDAVLDVAEAR